MRLIDAEQIGLTDMEIIICDGNYKKVLEMLIDKIANAPSIDAVQYTNDEIQRMQDIEQAQIQKAYDIGKADAKQQWIPVEERLPEKENKSYWICTDGGYQCQCRWTNDMYGFGAHEWSEWAWSIFDIPQYSKVIAWMPLPQPYERKEE